MKVLRLLGAAGVIMLTVAGCNKSNDNIEPEPVAAISFYNGSPDAPKLAYYLNTNRISADSLSYKNYYDYVYARAGQRELSVYRGTEKKFAKTVTLDQGHIYSAFLTGAYANAEFVVLEDSLIRPNLGKAHVRFVNMSIGAPALDLLVNDGSLVSTNRAYKANSGYKAIDANKQYTFVIRDAGGTTNKVILPSINIIEGASYTIWARGVYTATDATALGAEIVRNY